jgi:uracil-DNA glycosylase
MSSIPRANPGSPLGSRSVPQADPGPAATHLNPLVLFNQEVIRCQRCSRLRKYCEGIATSKRRAYRDWIYWAKPVPSFGDEKAHLLILGLAPGAHGSNRTGRPFTGDGSGDFLYPVLYDARLASQPTSISRGDGLRLLDCWISAVVRCAPPDNTPKRSELKNCAPYLDQEIALLTNSAASPLTAIWSIWCAPGRVNANRVSSSPMVPSTRSQGAATSSPVSIRRCKTPIPASSREGCFLMSSNGPAFLPAQQRLRARFADEG